MAQPPRPQRFRQNRAIVDPKTGYPTIEFLRNLNSGIDLTNFLADLQAATAAAQIAADNAQTAANNAQTAAETAQDAADNAATAGGVTALEQSINASYPTNFVGPLLSADSTGQINVASHDRVYGSSTLNPTVSVVGATVPTAFVSGDVVRVYYDDPTRAGGAVSYQTTLSPTVAAQTGNRHSVGAIIIPAAGSQDGLPTLPPGGVQI